MIRGMAKNKQPAAKWYSAWATAWGPIGACANDKGICRLVLPHYLMDDLLALLGWEHQGAVRDEGPFRELNELSAAYFSGQVVDFGSIQVDLPGETTFFGKVYRQARAIPYGKTVCYSDLAKQMDQPEAARAVATCLSKNSVPLVIPCHRVTYKGGGMGGFSAEGGEALKQRMLDLEASRR